MQVNASLRYEKKKKKKKKKDSSATPKKEVLWRNSTFIFALLGLPNFRTF